MAADRYPSTGTVCADSGCTEEREHMDGLYRHRSFQSDANLEWDDEDLTGKRRREREAAKAAHKEWLDEKLDIALEDSFPASDPVSIAQPPQSPYDKLKP